MVTAHVDSDCPEQELVDEFVARLDGTPADIAMNIALTIVVKIYAQVYGTHLDRLDAAIDGIVPQLKEAVRLELALGAEEYRAN